MSDDRATSRTDHGAGEGPIGGGPVGEGPVGEEPIGERPIGEGRAPHLSFVMVGRNDGFGGDFLGRMRVCLEALAEGVAAVGLDAEVVVVEWNPPADRPRLAAALPASAFTDHLPVRWIEVPPEVHRGIENSDRMPLFEYLGKNVGVRRARGEFVLITNPDIVFSRQMLEALVPGRLHPGRCYRAERFDVGEDVPRGLDLAEAEAFCAARVFQVLRRYWVEAPGGPQAEMRNDRRGPPPPAWPFSRGGWLRNLALRLAGRRPEFWATWKRLIHIGAGGDFLLLHRAAWAALRGFPQLPTHSHLDTIFATIAVRAGYDEDVLAPPIYHQPHGREDHADRPPTEYLDQAWFLDLVYRGTVPVLNDEDWGLATTELPERCGPLVV